jgi:hypothetical protein
VRPHFSERFVRSYASTPAAIQRAFDRKLELLLHNLRHPSLRAKKYDEALTAVLTNNDSAPHTISSITITGTDASDFTPTNTCPVFPNTLAAGASCTIAVTFTPAILGRKRPGS